MYWGPRFKLLSLILVTVLSLLVAIPSLVQLDPKSKYREIFHPVKLGLDLVGGLHLLLNVDSQDYYAQVMQALKDDIRTSLREYNSSAESKIKFHSLRFNAEYVSFKVIDDKSDVENMLEDSIPDVEVEYLGNQRMVKVRYSKKKKAQINNDLLARSIEILRKRVDGNGINEASIFRQGSDRIVVQIPGIQDVSMVKNSLDVTAKLNFHLLSKDNQNSSSSRTYYQYDQQGKKIAEYQLSPTPVVSGESLIEAKLDYSQERLPIVSIRFDSKGKKKFADTTKRYTGKQLAIVLDNKVISAPVISVPIVNGLASINGNFTVASAVQLANLLQSGALPARLIITEEKFIGPSLGADSIVAGKKAVIISILLVMIFMALTYKKFGIIANMAIIANILIILAVLTLIGVTLTLPGIAGIVLTIGMSVDANILVFERIREENKKSGNNKNIIILDKSFDSAYKAILDSNITTLIVAVALFAFGYGAIKGFAITLAIGIVTSMFSAIVLTKSMLMIWLGKQKVIKI